MESLPNDIRSRLELLNKAENYASEYEEAYDAASAALTAAKKQQTDAVSEHRVTYMYLPFLRLTTVK